MERERLEEKLTQAETDYRAYNRELEQARLMINRLEVQLIKQAGVVEAFKSLLEKEEVVPNDRA